MTKLGSEFGNLLHIDNKPHHVRKLKSKHANFPQS